MFWKRRPRSTPQKDPQVLAAERLHIGCGGERIEGWLNVDLQELPGVDVVCDVTEGLPFEGVKRIFAEHFLEHLRVDDALDFLCEAHRVLVPGGIIRLSTPNLDWLMVCLYRIDEPAELRRQMAITVNKGFRAWQHQFLWNRELLEEALQACGFAELTFCDYGESRHPELRGLERHLTSDDSPGFPHVLVVEATRATAQPERLARLRSHLEKDFLAHLDLQ